MTVDIRPELRTMALAVNGSVVRRLVSLGVSHLTIANLGRDHYSLGVIGAAGGEDGLYEPDPDAPAHLVLPVYEDGDLIDLVAFRTGSPCDWRLRVGEGWALGVEHGLESYRWDEPLPLHLSPLDWMRGDCTGLCVLDWSAPSVAKLRDFDTIHCDEPRLERLLRAALSRAPRLPKIISCQGYKHAA